jgi:hypothetical protein
MILLCCFVAAVLGVQVKSAELSALQSLISALQCSSVPACTSLTTSATCPSEYITCDATGSVTSISLFNVGLTGSVSASIGQLSNLQTLLLARNSLLGTVPTSIGLLTRLNTLQLYDNPHLTGTLPTEVVRLTALSTLNLRGCGLSGRLPALDSLRPTLGMCILGIEFLPQQNCFDAPCPAACQCLDAVVPECVPPTTTTTTTIPTTTTTTTTITNIDVTATMGSIDTTSTNTQISSAPASAATKCFGELRPGTCTVPSMCAAPATPYFSGSGSTDGTCGSDACCVPAPLSCAVNGTESGVCLSRAECALHGGDPVPLDACIVDGQFMVQCCLNHTFVSPPTTATSAGGSDSTATSALPSLISAAATRSDLSWMLMSIGVLLVSCQR